MRGLDSRIHVVLELSNVTSAKRGRRKGTTTQIANAAGGAVPGAGLFAIEAVSSTRTALLVSAALIALSTIVSAAFLSWMRPVTGVNGAGA
jgi:hypothetical protein